MEEKVEKIKAALKQISDIYDIILFTIVFLQIIFMFLNFSAVYYIAVLVADVVLFVFTKDCITEKSKFSTLFFWFRISLILASCDIINQLLRTFASSIKGRITPILFIMPDLIIILALSYLLFSKNADKTDKIYKIQFLNLKPKEESSNGDIVICKDKNHNKPISVKYKSRFLHFLILGPTGSGKTSKILIPMIWQDIQNFDCSVIVIEPKGDLVEMVSAMGDKINENGKRKRKVQFFRPTDPDCPYFNPLDGKEELVIENMIKVFTMLSPDSKQYFQDITDKVLRNSIMLLKRVEKAYTNPETGISKYPATLVTLNDVVQNVDGKALKMIKILGDLPANASQKNQNMEIIQWFNNDFLNERSKIRENSSGIKNQISKITSNKYLRRILNPPDGRSDVNFDRIMAQNECIAITTSQDLLDELGKYLGYFLILNLQSSVFRRPGNEFTRKPSYLYIDEAQEYLNPGYARLLTQGRSFRCSSVLATQGLDQLAMGNGKDGEKFVKSVMSNARNQIIFPGLNVEDSTYFEKLFGSDEVEEISESNTEQKFNPLYGFKSMNYPSHSTRKQKKDKQRFSATELREMPDDQIAYRIIDGMTVCQAEYGKVDYIDYNLNEELKAYINRHNEIQAEKRAKMDEIEKEEERKYNIYNINAKANDSTSDSNNSSPDDDDEEMKPDVLL